MFSAITTNLKGNMKQALPVLVLTVALIVVSVALLLVRWSVAPPRAAVFDLGDPAVTASHFYGPEKSANVGFRWSKTASAISLPALSTNQVISITLNPARVIDGNPLHFRLSVGSKTWGATKYRQGGAPTQRPWGPDLARTYDLLSIATLFTRVRRMPEDWAWPYRRSRRPRERVGWGCACRPTCGC